jgi:hypothetical protein
VCDEVPDCGGHGKFVGVRDDAEVVGIGIEGSDAQKKMVAGGLLAVPDVVVNGAHVEWQGKELGRELEDLGFVWGEMQGAAVAA